jgi:hypothetical protein
MTDQEHILRRVTDGVSLGGVTSPLWRDGLDMASGIAVSLVPILSAAWLAVQIARFVIEWRRGAKHGRVG